MNIIDTLYNINISKTKFFNLKGKNYLNMDLLKNNLHFISDSNNKKLNYIMSDIGKYYTPKLKKYSPKFIYYYSSFMIHTDSISKINYIIK